MISKTEYAARLMAEYPAPPSPEQYEAVVRAIVEEYGCSRTNATSTIGKVRYRRPEFRDWALYVKPGSREPLPEKKPAPINPRVSAERSQHPTGLAGFRKLYDKSLIVPEKIKEKISTYLKEKGWEHDEQFRQVCGIRQVDWRKYRDEFSHLQVRVDGRLIWGHPEIIDEMREVVLR